MFVKMLVAVSRSDGFSAKLGQIIDLKDAVAADLIKNRMAEPAMMTDKIPGVVLPPAIGDTPEDADSIEVGNIDLRDGASDEEATLASKTLSRRKVRAT